MRGNYKILHRRVKNPRVEVSPGGEIRIIVPPGVNPEKIIAKYRRWIEKKLREMEGFEEKSRILKPFERNEEEFREAIKELIAEAERVVGVKVRKVSFRRMKTRWGSCSSNARVTINSFAIVLPEHLLRYIVFHEVAHLKEMNHSKDFYRIMDRIFPDHRIAAKELGLWWYFIRKNML